MIQRTTAMDIIAAVAPVFRDSEEDKNGSSFSLRFD
jgi:hypothetical protein